jgi:hypothetical protein
MAYIRTTARAGLPKIDLDRLFDGQHGLAARRQILAAGLDDETIRRELRARRWQRVLPGIYANQTGVLTLDQRRVAAVLFTSPNAQLTGIGALLWHNFRYLPADPLVHVLIPHEVRRSSRGFVRVQRTHRLDTGARAAGGYTVCSVARAVADACRGLSNLRDVRAIVAEAVQRGLAPVKAIEEELALAGTNRTALLRRAVREVGTGARSAPEVELQEILPPSGSVPPIVWNPELQSADGSRLPSPDGWIAEVGIALEVDSREYHLSPDDWQRTLRRHNILSSYGALVLHFTPSEIRNRKRSVRHTVERACVERAAIGATTAIRVLQSPSAG